MNKETRFPTLQEIQDAHATKREYERYLPLSRYVFRPVGFLLAWIIIRTRLSSEAVSWLSGLVGLIGSLCLLSTQEQLIPIGIVLLLFFNLLDCVDGSMARTMNTQNPYGRFLDSLMGWMDIGFWAIIGVMVYHHSKLLSFPNPFEYGSIFWLAVGGLTCYFFVLTGYIERIFDVSIRNKWKNMKANFDIDSKNITQERNKTKTDYKKIFPSRVMNIIRIINHNLRVRETHYLLLVLAYFGSMVDLFLAFFLLYYFLHTIMLIIIYSARGRQLRNFQNKF